MSPSAEWYQDYPKSPEQEAAVQAWEQAMIRRRVFLCKIDFVSPEGEQKTLLGTSLLHGAAGEGSVFISHWSKNGELEGKMAAYNVDVLGEGDINNNLGLEHNSYPIQENAQVYVSTSSGQEDGSITLGRSFSFWEFDRRRYNDSLTNNNSLMMAGFAQAMNEAFAKHPTHFRISPITPEEMEEIIVK